MTRQINSLNAELNPICHLLALLGAHHILHVSGLRVKFGRQYANFDVSLTFHLSIFILAINQLDAQNLLYNKFISLPCMGRPVHGTVTCRCDDTRGCIIQF